MYYIITYHFIFPLFLLHAPFCISRLDRGHSRQQPTLMLWHDEGIPASTKTIGGQAARQPGSQAASQPPIQPASQPARLCACPPVRLPACLPARPRRRPSRRSRRCPRRSRR